MAVGVLAPVVLASCSGRDAAESAAGPSALKTTVMFGEIGHNPGQFHFPRAMDSDGRALWIVDKAAVVQRIDPKTGDCTARWKMPESVQGKPTGITVGPRLPGAEGRPESASPYLLYVPDTHYHRVMVYEPPVGAEDSPRLVASFGSYGEGPGEFIYLTDVAVLPGADGRAERLYVPEYGGNDRVSVFDARDLRFLFSFGTLGMGEDPKAVEFDRPQSIVLDAERKRVVIADACNHRIGVFTLDGELIAWHGSPEHAGTGPEEMAFPYGLALLADGTALVSEYGSHRVRHMDVETGETLALYGKPGREKGELSSPWAVAVAGDTAYVLDSGNARVQGFSVPRARRSAERAADGGAPERAEGGRS